MTGEKQTTEPLPSFEVLRKNLEHGINSEQVTGNDAMGIPKTSESPNKTNQDQL